MEIFWSEHIPWNKTWSRQYQAALYYHNEAQSDIVYKDIEVREQINNKKIQTVIEPLKKFFIAEDYHQKHYLQQFPVLMREFESYFSYFSDFNNSPTVAKVNGFASGKGSQSELKKFLSKMKLSEKVQTVLSERTNN